MYREIKIKATRQGENKAKTFSILTDALSISKCEELAHWYLLHNDFDCETDEENKLTGNGFTIDKVAMANYTKVFPNENPAIDAEGYEYYEVVVLTQIIDEKTNKEKTIKEKFLIPVEAGFEQAQKLAREMFEGSNFDQVDTVSRRPNIIELVKCTDNLY